MPSGIIQEERCPVPRPASSSLEPRHRETVMSTMVPGPCKKPLSEDLNDGQDYGGVTVRNPFRDSLA